MHRCGSSVCGPPGSGWCSRWHSGSSRSSAERADRIREAQAARGGSARGLRAMTTTVVPLLVQVLQLAHTVSEALDARGADDVPLRRRALPEAS